MTDAPKPKAYMVCAAFGLPPNAMIMTNACVSPSSEGAVAMCVAMFCQETGTKEPIQGINCMELTEAFMADALTAIRGGDKPKVVSLREVETPALTGAPTPPYEPQACYCPAAHLGLHVLSCPSWKPLGPSAA